VIGAMLIRATGGDTGGWCHRSRGRFAPHQGDKLVNERAKRLAILVGGGPAPGINSVIGAATIRAELSGVEVLGIQDGFQWLMQGDISHTQQLKAKDVSRIHFRGGSHIGIARANPTTKEEYL
jgi:6-phosphofructokinase